MFNTKSIIKNASTLCLISLSFTHIPIANAYQTTENCSKPDQGVYRVGGDGKDYIYESFNNPNVCWGYVNKIILAPRNQEKTDSDDEYRYVRLVLSHVTEARADVANDADIMATDPALAEQAKLPLLITNGLSQSNHVNQTNLNNTQVKVGGQFYYSFSIQGGTNWKLSGKGDLINYPGHYPGTANSYSKTQGTYGIQIDGYFVENRNGLGVEGYTTRDPSGNVIATKIASDFEIEFIEVSRAGFAGMHIKTERRNPGGIPLDNTAYPMQNLKIHDNYIHDSVGEGIYLGSTSESKYQHAISDISIWNNRILRTGAEAIQTGQLTGNNKIYNNVFGPAALKWRAPFTSYQDSTVQIDFRTGTTELFNNIIMGSANNLLIIADNYVGVPVQGDGVFVHNNYFSGTRYLGLYIKQANTTDENFDHYSHVPVFRFENNHWRNQVFERDLAFPTTQSPMYLFSTHNTQATISFKNETWVASNNSGFISQLPSGNGVSNSGKISGENNIMVSSINAVKFADVDDIFQLEGAPSNIIDELNMEVFALTYGKHVGASGDPVHYPYRQVVMTQKEQKWNEFNELPGGEFFRCVSLDGCVNEAPDPDNQSGVWSLVAAPFDASSNTKFKDNFIVDPSSTFSSLGVQLTCKVADEFSILPIISSGQFGQGFSTLLNAHDRQQQISYDNLLHIVVSEDEENENLAVYFYTDQTQGRTAYLDLGVDYQNLRIEEVWTRYRKWSMRVKDGVNTPRTGFKRVTWYENLNDASGIEESSLNFHTAKIESHEANRQVWKRDNTNTGTIVPKGRYLVLETYPLSEDYDYSRALEFALVGWVADPRCP